MSLSRSRQLVLILVDIFKKYKIIMKIVLIRVKDYNAQAPRKTVTVNLKNLFITFSSYVKLSLF